MTSQDEVAVALEPPAKRRRLSFEHGDKNEHNLEDSVPSIKMFSADQQKEFDVGIQAYVDPRSEVLEGVLKQRYSDFIVNEILPNGNVVHLTSTKAPRPKQQKAANNSVQVADAPSNGEEVSQGGEPASELVQQNGKGRDSEQKVESLPDVAEADREKLVGYFNEDAVKDILKLYHSIKEHPTKKAHEHPTVRTDFTTDRSVRSQIHQHIREVFKSTIESSTDHDGVLILKAANMNSRGKQQGNSWNRPQNKNQRPGKLGWLDRGGEYLHFTIYKENKDTMEVVSWLTRNLKCNAKNFQFAGTKDRRAVTTQRCSAYRIEAERLEAQNKTLRGSKVGDFEYHQQGLELGDLSGNEFVITLRDCKILNAENTPIDLDSFTQELQTRMQSLHSNGYLNYYGQQRFGTFSTRTDVIGRYILQENFQAACDAILEFQQDALAAAQQPDSTATIGQDDKNRALAIHTWRKDGTLNAALDILPRKFSAEAQLMRHLAKQSGDYLGALMTIQRNLRLMYVHAHQSYIWNMVATNRMKLYGSKVVAGDLVLVHEHKDKAIPSSDDTTTNDTTTDADGEQIIAPAPHDRATAPSDVFERARPLSAAEASSNAYTIFDIVLPQPGYDILYPANASGTYYETFMATPAGGQLDPHNMRRKHREFSLSGSYRKVVARIGQAFAVETDRYSADNEQLAKTDLDNLYADAGNEAATATPAQQKREGDKVAAVLKFQLGASQYATVALRELSKGGIVQYKPDFSGGR